MGKTTKSLAMATPSPAKPWERNRSAQSNRTSSLGTESSAQGTQGPALPPRGQSSLSRTTPYGSSMYAGGSYANSPYGGSMYGSSMYGSGGYGGRYGGSMYGNSTYGGSMYGSRYGSSMYGGMGGSMYGSRYGSSMYGGMGGMYGSRYGGMGSTYSQYGLGYDDESYRNPYPRGKYWNYGEGEVDEFGNPIDGEPPQSLLMDMENVVEGFGHFTRVLDYNFDAMHGSFASVLRLFDSLGELRRIIYYGLQGFAIFSFFGKLLISLQRFLYNMMGKPIPDRLQPENISASLSSLEDQWNGGNKSLSPVSVNRGRQKSNSRAVLLLLTFFAVVLGGPMVFSAIYRMMVGAPKRTNRPRRRPVQVEALYDFNGQSQGDLAFKKGDKIVIHQQVSEGWLKGELSNGTVGLVPESYVRPIQSIPNQQPHPNHLIHHPPGPHIDNFNEQEFLSQQPFP